MSAWLIEKVFLIGIIPVDATVLLNQCQSFSLILILASFKPVYRRLGFHPVYLSLYTQTHTTRICFGRWRFCSYFEDSDWFIDWDVKLLHPRGFLGFFFFGHGVSNLVEVKNLTKSRLVAVSFYLLINPNTNLVPWNRHIDVLGKIMRGLLDS